MATSIWYGLVDNDWGNGNNFDGGLPGAGDDVIISARAVRGIDPHSGTGTNYGRVDVQKGYNLHIGSNDDYLSVRSDEVTYGGSGFCHIGGNNEVMIISTDNYDPRMTRISKHVQSTSEERDTFLITKGAATVQFVSGTAGSGAGEIYVNPAFPALGVDLHIDKSPDQDFGMNIWIGPGGRVFTAGSPGSILEEPTNFVNIGGDIHLCGRFMKLLQFAGNTKITGSCGQGSSGQLSGNLWALGGHIDIKGDFDIDPFSTDKVEIGPTAIANFANPLFTIEGGTSATIWAWEGAKFIPPPAHAFNIEYY